jgi:hypothetical protein
MNDASWPLELRAFIFEKKVKNDLMYVKEVIPDTKISNCFLNPLYHLIR